MYLLLSHKIKSCHSTGLDDSGRSVGARVPAHVRGMYTRVMHTLVGCQVLAPRQSRGSVEELLRAQALSLLDFLSGEKPSTLQRNSRVGGSPDQ